MQLCSMNERASVEDVFDRNSDMVLSSSEEVTYIYDVNYEMKKLKALVNVRPSSDLVYAINPAFWRGLDIDINWKA